MTIPLRMNRVFNVCRSLRVWRSVRGPSGRRSIRPSWVHLARGNCVDRSSDRQVAVGATASQVGLPSRPLRSALFAQPGWRRAVRPELEAARQPPDRIRWCCESW